MRLLAIALPVLGTLAVLSLPFLRHAEKVRRDAVVIEALADIRAAQDALFARTGGYATDLETLSGPCGAAAGVPWRDPEARLAEVEFVLVLRAAADTASAGPVCAGRALAHDYYVAAAPASARNLSQQAFAARADGRVFVFYDGVAPRESDMASGLATPLEAVGTFRIP